MSAIDAIRGQEIKVLKVVFIFTLLSPSITFQGAEVFFYFHIVITYYHFSRCWSGSPSSGLSPTSPSPPFPSSWLSQLSSPTYTGRNWLSPESTQWRPYFFAQRSRAQQVDRWLDLHVSLPFQPRPNAAHTFPFCSDGHHQALCQVCCHLPITNYAIIHNLLSQRQKDQRLPKRRGTGGV